MISKTLIKRFLFFSFIYFLFITLSISTAQEQGNDIKEKTGSYTKQKIEVQKQGRYLVLKYKLLGSDGGGIETDRSTPPVFSVYKGNKLIASGKFQYG